MDIDQFHRKARRQKGRLSRFLRKLDEVVPEDFSRLARELDRSVWAEIDCTRCAHCCKTMTPTYKHQDIKRIAAHLNMNPKDFVSQWLEKEAEGGEWVNRQQPCPFLQDNRCSIYEVRPADCAAFPHHHRRPLDAYNETLIQNLDKCPASLDLVQKLEKRVREEYIWES